MAITWNNVPSANLYGASTFLDTGGRDVSEGLIGLGKTISNTAKDIKTKEDTAEYTQLKKALTTTTDPDKANEILTNSNINNMNTELSTDLFNSVSNIKNKYTTRNTNDVIAKLNNTQDLDTLNTASNAELSPEVLRNKYGDNINMGLITSNIESKRKDFLNQKDREISSNLNQLNLHMAQETKGQKDNLNYITNKYSNVTKIGEYNTLESFYKDLENDKKFTSLNPETQLAIKGLVTNKYKTLNKPSELATVKLDTFASQGQIAITNNYKDSIEEADKLAIKLGISKDYILSQQVPTDSPDFISVTDARNKLEQDVGSDIRVVNAGLKKFFPGKIFTGNQLAHITRQAYSWNTAGLIGGSPHSIDKGSLEKVLKDLKKVETGPNMQIMRDLYKNIEKSKVALTTDLNTKHTAFIKTASLNNKNYAANKKTTPLNIEPYNPAQVQGFTIKERIQKSKENLINDSNIEQTDSFYGTNMANREYAARIKDTTSRIQKSKEGLTGE